MDNTKTGGPAYPSQPTFHTPHGAIGVTENDGMTLLDAFAGLAMQSVVANGGSLVSDKGTAERSYRIAAAMIAERSRLMNEKP